MNKNIKIKLLIFAVTIAFVITSCSSAVNNTQRSNRKTSNSSGKSSNNTNSLEDDSDLLQDSASIPLTLEAIEDGTIILTGSEIKRIYFQKNDGIIQESMNNIFVKAGDKIHFYGYDFLGGNGSLRISCVTDCYIYGNVMSLLYNTDFKDKKEIKQNTVFYNLFKNNTHIKNHDSLDIVLPATVLSNYCYSYMFSGCTGLTRIPELSATTLANYCYEYMFAGCNSLTTLPDINIPTMGEGSCSYMFSGCKGLTKAPAVNVITMAKNSCAGMFSDCTKMTSAPGVNASTMAEYCCRYMFKESTNLVSVTSVGNKDTTMAHACCESMFEGCTSLTDAPALPSIKLDSGCYYLMFKDCTSLIKAPELPADTLKSGCYQKMFQNCTSLKAAPELRAKSLEQYCYNSMFEGCTSLNYVKCLAKTIPATSCTLNWLKGVSMSGKFVRASGVNWEAGVSGRPQNWTVEDSN